MATNWAEIGGKCYYFDDNGLMKTGTVTIDGKKYHFDSSGQMQTSNITIKGPTLEEAAEIAQDVYFEDFKEHTLPSGYSLTECKNDVGSLQIGVYERVRADGETDYVLANRGTRGLSLEYSEDWDNNIDQVSGNSEDVKASIKYVDEFIKKHPYENITFVGHSKGGVEALINAVRTGKDAIVFNPAAPNLTDIGLSTSDYHEKATSYVVKGEILNELQGSEAIGEIGDVVYLPKQYQVYHLPMGSNLVSAEINNHYMNAVKDGIIQYRSEGN